MDWVLWKVKPSCTCMFIYTQETVPQSTLKGRSRGMQCHQKGSDQMNAGLKKHSGSPLPPRPRKDDKENVLNSMECETVTHVCLLMSRQMCLGFYWTPDECKTTRMVLIHWTRSSTNAPEGGSTTTTTTTTTVKRQKQRFEQLVRWNIFQGECLVKLGGSWLSVILKSGYWC